MHIKRGRTLRLAVALGVAATLALPTAAGAIEIDPPPPPPPPPCPTSSVPKYSVKAVSFKAADETNADYLGSDEPYFILGSAGTDGTNKTRKTSSFGDVDSGETRNFGGLDYVWSDKCGAVAPMGIGYSLQVWEHDLGNSEETRAKTAQYFKYAGTIADYVGENYPSAKWVGEAVKHIGTATNLILEWGKDDLIGSSTSSFTTSELTSKLTSKGKSFTKNIYLGGAETSGGGDYYVDLRVTRTA